MPKSTVLVVDDDKSILTGLRLALEGDCDVLTADHGAQALSLLHETEPELLLLDIGLPDVNGMDLLAQLKSAYPEIVVIMITAVEDTRTVVKALKLGAYDYLIKPIDAQELRVTLQNALETKLLKEKIRRIQKPNVERYRFDMIGSSPQIKAMTEIAQKVTGSIETPILILGETGSGKGVLARTIHYSFTEFPGPFVQVNCSAIPHELFESELFGYERGAFTGAKSEGRIGRFEDAASGTLFLDEIGTLSLADQSKLLGVLDDRVFYRVGGTKPHRVSARIISATNSDLEKSVEAGVFRRDLFFRLNVVRIVVPPLRERVMDIMPLTEYFISHFNRKYGRNFTKVSPEARKALLDYSWPGNVRELRNAVERIILLESGTTILPNHLPFHRADMETTVPSEPGPAGGTPGYEDVIIRLMREALDKTGGNVLEAARLLNMPAHKMRYRIKKYDLKIS